MQLRPPISGIGLLTAVIVHNSYAKRYISSSCSFAALATTKALFQKGAGFAPAIAFLLASTNLVIELGIVIGIFLGWQFVVGEYAGGILLILFTWLLYRLTRPKKNDSPSTAAATGRKRS